MAAEGQFPDLSILVPQALVYCVIFGVVRYLLNVFFLKNFALFAMKLKFIRQSRIREIDQESSFKGKMIPSQDTIKSFCLVHSTFTPAQVSEYLYTKRRNASVQKKVTKFSEAFWRFSIYAYFVWLGYETLFLPQPSPWILDTKELWTNWPQLPSAAMLYYHQMELGCYMHQLMWTEVSRSDAAEMILHHVVTISLILVSIITAHERMGSSVLLVHDIADIFLEAAKCFNYASKAKGQKYFSIVCDSLFVVFALSFFVTRLVIFPRFLIYSEAVEAPEALGFWPGLYAIVGFLCILVCLHVFWFFLIGRMIVRLLSSGIEKDERSDDEDEEPSPSPSSLKKHE